MALSTAHHLAGPIPSFLVAAGFAVAVAWTLWYAWHPPLHTYLDYVPIGGVFAAFFWDRLFPSWRHSRRALLFDASAVVLAVMRVFVPPLPFISGHALFATYAMLSARGRPLRVLALLVLAQVLYVKLVASGGVLSLVGGIIVAFTLSRTRESQRLAVDECSTLS